MNYLEERVLRDKIILDLDGTVTDEYDEKDYYDKQFDPEMLKCIEGILQSDATGHQDLDKKEWPTFHATGQHFGVVPPPMVRTHPTGHQSHHKIHYQPTSIHIRRSHFPLRGQARLVTPHILPMSLLPIH